jgi:hypothetical protein
MLVISRHLRQIFRLHMEKPPPFRTFLRPLKTAGPVNECAPGFLDSDRAHNNSQQHPGRCVHISGIHPRLPFHVARRNPALKTVDLPPCGNSIDFPTRIPPFVEIAKDRRCFYFSQALGRQNAPRALLKLMGESIEVV